jgi:hypothetical protein
MTKSASNTRKILLDKMGKQMLEMARAFLGIQWSVFSMESIQRHQLPQPTRQKMQNSILLSLIDPPRLLF